MTHLTSDNFFQEAERSELPVLIDFYAAWCGPCKALAPTFESLAEQYGARVKFCKVDVDAEPQLAEKFGIMSVPTLVLLKNGRVSQQLSGVRTAAELTGTFALS